LQINNRNKLFFLPYAGASVYNYAKWHAYTPLNFDIVFLEYPGRGERDKEKYSHSIEDLVDDLYQKIKDIIVDTNYYIFGHSLGALVGYELVLKLQSENLLLPKTVFLSGRVPPEFCEKTEVISDLPDLDFLEIISQYGGIPRELYDDGEARRTFLPTLRADFKLLEKYKKTYKIEKLMCHTCIFYAEEDTSTREKDVLKWKDYVNKDLYFVRFKGEHFYCMEEPAYIEILNRIDMMAKIYGSIKER